MSLPEGRTVLAPAHGAAFSIARGASFRITDIEGAQVSDLVAFLSGDVTEAFSPGNTRKLNSSLLLTTGSTLFSNRCTPLLRIRTDKVGRHDITSSWCSPYDYPIRFGLHDHPSCLAILTDALAEYNIQEHMIPEPFNVFMKTDIDYESGQIEVARSPSTPDDYIEFEALADCLVGLTVCPQDQNLCNGGTITPLAVEVLTSNLSSL